MLPHCTFLSCCQPPCWLTSPILQKPPGIRSSPHPLPLKTHQAGLAAAGSEGKGMACPLGCQNSIQKAPLQVGAVLGTGVESDTTTLAVNLSNKGLGFLAAASRPGPEAQRSTGGPPGTKGMPSWYRNGEKSGKLGAPLSPGAEQQGWALRGPPAFSSVGVERGGWISANGRGCWGWGWRHQLSPGLPPGGPWAVVGWGAALKGQLGWIWQPADQGKAALAGAVSEQWQAWPGGPQFLDQASGHATGSAFCSGGAGGGGSGRGWKPGFPLWAPRSPKTGAGRSCRAVSPLPGAPLLGCSTPRGQSHCSGSCGR